MATTDDDLTPPPREGVWYPCCCRLRLRVNDDGKAVHSCCIVLVRGSDQPICDPCTVGGHPENPDFDPVLPTDRKPVPVFSWDVTWGAP